MKKLLLVRDGARNIRRRKATKHVIVGGFKEDVELAKLVRKLHSLLVYVEDGVKNIKKRKVMKHVKVKSLEPNAKKDVGLVRLKHQLQVAGNGVRNIKKKMDKRKHAKREDIETNVKNVERVVL